MRYTARIAQLTWVYPCSYIYTSPTAGRETHILSWWLSRHGPKLIVPDVTISPSRASKIRSHAVTRHLVGGLNSASNFYPELYDPHGCFVPYLPTDVFWSSGSCTHLSISTCQRPIRLSLPYFHVPADSAVPSQLGLSSIWRFPASSFQQQFWSFLFPIFLSLALHSNRLLLTTRTICFTFAFSIVSSFMWWFIVGYTTHCPSHQPHLCCGYSLFIIHLPTLDMFRSRKSRSVASMVCRYGPLSCHKPLQSDISISITGFAILQLFAGSFSEYSLS